MKQQRVHKHETWLQWNCRSVVSKSKCQNLGSPPWIFFLVALGVGPFALASRAFFSSLHVLGSWLGFGLFNSWIVIPWGGHSGSASCSPSFILTFRPKSSGLLHAQPSWLSPLSLWSQSPARFRALSLVLCLKNRIISRKIWPIRVGVMYTTHTHLRCWYRGV